MSIERKAFKAIYNLIQSGCVSEKQAYDLCVAVFWQPPTFDITTEENNTPTTEEQTPAQTIVKGFAGGLECGNSYDLKKGPQI